MSRDRKFGNPLGPQRQRATDADPPEKSGEAPVSAQRIVGRIDTEMALLSFPIVNRSLEELERPVLVPQTEVYQRVRRRGDIPLMYHVVQLLEAGLCLDCISCQRQAVSEMTERRTQDRSSPALRRNS